MYMWERTKRSISATLPKGLKTSWWLIKISVPVSFLVLLLNYFGILDLMAVYTSPVFHLFGLPGNAAIILITSIFTNIYSVVAVITTLNLPFREGVIIGTMCLVSHNFIIETIVLKKTGSSIWRMLCLRILSSLIIGVFLDKIIPGSGIINASADVVAIPTFSIVFIDWVRSISMTILKILVLVNLLMIAQNLMEEFGLIKLLEKPLIPILKLMGLPPSTTFSWIVANLIGLAYGSAVMIEQVEEGKIKKNEADLLNHHIAVSHSQLEDPLLFLAMGYTIHWMIWPRIILAIVIVWLRKLEYRIRKMKAPSEIKA
jgi:spore maturation protein SpmB